MTRKRIDRTKEGETHMKRALTVLLFAAVLLLLSACGSNAAAGGTDTPSQPDTVSDPAPMTQADGSKETTENTALKEKDEGNALSLGESVELGDWSISVTAFELSTKLSDKLFSYAPDEGNQYAVVSVSVANNGAEADTFLPSFGFGDDIFAKIMYDKQYTYSSTNLLTYDADLHDEFLNPLSSATGVIVFSLPDVVANGTGSLSINFTAGANTAEFTLR